MDDEGLDPEYLRLMALYREAMKQGNVDQAADYMVAAIERVHDLPEEPSS